MVDSPDAAELRARWTPDGLGQYDGKWIAFRNKEVEASAPALAELLERYQDQIERADGPIFAFVYFGAFQ